MVLKLSKRVHILKFCADLSKKPESVVAIYIYASKSPHYTSKSKMLNHQKFNKNSSTSEPNISKTVRRSIKNNTIFWKKKKHREIFQMHILLRSAQNCKICTLLDNIRTIIQKGNMETRQMNPIVCTSSSFLLGEVESPTKFSKRGSLTEPQFLEGSFWKKGGWLSSGGLQF